LNGIQKKAFKWVTGTHIAVLLLLLIIPFFKGCFHKKPKELFVSVDFSGAPPPPPEMLDESEPEPKPAPKPKPILKPAVTNTPPKKVETKKPEPKKSAVTNAPPKKAITNAPPKPKTEEEKLAAIRQGGKPVKKQTAAPAAPTKKPLDLSGFKSALDSVATGSGSGTSTGFGTGSGGGMYSPFGWYYDRVKQQMYAVWQQPAGAPVGLTATAVVRVERDGTVSVKSITRRSGNAQFDQSVQSALNTTTRLPIPPADLPDRNISIEFAWLMRPGS
jgi:colicin import membrane protein